MGNDTEFFDIEFESKLTAQEFKAEKKWNKMEKHASDLSKRMNDMTLPYAERDKAEREYSDALANQDKASRELDNARNQIRMLKMERKAITDLQRILAQEDGEEQFNTSIEADNSFWKRPEKIVKRIREETEFEETEGFQKLRDYPFDECGRKMDLKEYLHTFKHKKLPIDCEINIVTIGNESAGVQCLTTPNATKINTVVRCKKRVIPKPEN